MTKEDKYIACMREIDIRLEKGGDIISDLGNISAILKKRLDYFWIGFYFLKNDQLVLGPFQGTPACVFLQIGKGVCGTCAENGETIIVPDVGAFPDHVACDLHSKSEIVIPLYDTNECMRGVFDIDSTELDAFDLIDKTYLEQIAEKVKPLWPASLS